MSAKPQVSFLSLTEVHGALAEDLKSAAERVIASGHYVLGPEVEAFEDRWAAYTGADHAVGVNSGLDALTLSLEALGVAPGDDVLVPSNTFIASWLAISAVGANPVPVEPDPDTHIITPTAAEAAITQHTRVVMPVHLYGRLVDLNGFEALARQHDLALLFDAAQAHGANDSAHTVGARGDASAWSFYPTKNLGALGDAGAITTNNPELAARLRRLRNYGSERKYLNVERGHNTRMDEMQAALLGVKLPLLDRWVAHRRSIAQRYSDHLVGLSSLVCPTEPGEPESHSWHLYVVRSSQRDRLATHLRETGIETLLHYPVPPHRQEAYRGTAPGDLELPIAELLSREVMSLPISPHLDERAVELVIDAVTAFNV